MGNEYKRLSTSLVILPAIVMIGGFYITNDAPFRCCDFGEVDSRNVHFFIAMYQPGDVILFETQAKGLYRKLKVWLLESPYDHVAIFYDYTKKGLPLVAESVGRGASIRSLYASKGRKVTVLRHANRRVAQGAATRAESLCDNPESWYDYYSIVRFVVPHLIWHKFTGRNMNIGYKRNAVYICSELADEAYDNIIPLHCCPPLPADFLNIKAFHVEFEETI